MQEQVTNSNEPVLIELTDDQLDQISGGLRAEWMDDDTMVEPRGIEPLTFAMPLRRSPS
jgi:bacteriocin-like protein